MTPIKEYTAIKKAELKQKIAESGITPRLAVIQVGNDPASESYIRGKKKDCEEVGIECIVLNLPEDSSEDKVRNVTFAATISTSYHGVILQLPLPSRINVKNVHECMNTFKDVDGFLIDSEFQPCTPLGIINYLKYNNYQFEGKNACVVGRSDIVGKPLAKMLTDLDCTVTLCHSKTYDLSYHTYYSDIVFTCIDKLGYFTHADFGDGTDVIDIGLGRSEEGKLIGNIHPGYLDCMRDNGLSDRILISGTGGVGLLTRLTLLENTYEAAMMQCGRKG